MERRKNQRDKDEPFTSEWTGCLKMFRFIYTPGKTSGNHFHFSKIKRNLQFFRKTKSSYTSSPKEMMTKEKTTRMMMMIMMMKTMMTFYKKKK